MQGRERPFSSPVGLTPSRQRVSLPTFGTFEAPTPMGRYSRHDRTYDRAASNPRTSHSLWQIPRDFLQTLTICFLRALKIAGLNLLLFSPLTGARGRSASGFQVGCVFEAAMRDIFLFIQIPFRDRNSFLTRTPHTPFGLGELDEWGWTNCASKQPHLLPSPPQEADGRSTSGKRSRHPLRAYSGAETERGKRKPRTRSCRIGSPRWRRNNRPVVPAITLEAAPQKMRDNKPLDPPQGIGKGPSSLLFSTERRERKRLLLARVGK